MAKRRGTRKGRPDDRKGGKGAGRRLGDGGEGAPAKGGRLPGLGRGGVRDDATPSERKSGEAALNKLRTGIDRVDRQLVELLNERAKLIVEVGKVKRGSGIPIYTPHREQAVLQRVRDANQGPLPDRTVEAVYREIMSGSFALEQPLRIGYLGPPGSFSHQAAVRQFGQSVSFEDLHEISGVFTEVRRGHCHYGLVPIENSTHGGVAETLDAFRDSGAEIKVYAEVLLEVHHALLAACEPREVRRIHSKPEAFSQCRQWLSTQFPTAELVPAASTSRAVQTALSEHMLEPGRGSAAIASVLAGQIYGLMPLFERIEDNPNNITRFFVVAKQEAQPSGDDKTSIMFSTADKPGALVSVLRSFEQAGVNLTHIDKRPSGRTNWTYTFFVDAAGHRTDARVAEAIDDARTHCHELVVLGSYPRAKRIL
ncbi:MAG: prephenate dehydratase [Phycisphaerales bacterium]|nr:prephenate dehydratase [Phycisphaerales bacterium]